MLKVFQRLLPIGPKSLLHSGNLWGGLGWLCWFINRGLLLFIFVMHVPLTSYAQAKTPTEEIPLQAILDGKGFATWRQSFSQTYNSWVRDSRFDFRPVGSTFHQQRIEDGITLLTVAFEHQKGSLLYAKSAGGVLAIPPNPAKSKPIVIAIHGHEYGPYGKQPIGLFADNAWPLLLVKAGYIVWTPNSMYHEGFDVAAQAHGYIPLWTKIVSQGLDYVGMHFFARLPHMGYAALGLSSGGHIAFSLMAYRSDIRAGIFAGADQSLGFLREQYVIKGHPDCWEIPGIASYTTIWSLLAPRPVQFQMGERDEFFPDGKPFSPVAPSFKGTKRDQTTDEIAGQYLILRELWKRHGAASNINYHKHNGGHEMDVAAAIKFIAKKLDVK